MANRYNDYVRAKALEEGARALGLGCAFEKNLKIVLEHVFYEKDQRRRLPRTPPPEGGISVSDAARKYGLPNSTIGSWIARGWLSIIDNSGNWTYVKESDIVHLMQQYYPGRGNRPKHRKNGENKGNNALSFSL